MSVKTNICSLQKHEDGFHLNSRVVPDYNLIYVTRGKVVWVVDGKNWPMGEGSLAIVPPHVEHHAFSETQKVTLGSIHVEVSLPSGQNVFDLLKPPSVQKVPPGSWLDLYWRGAMKEFDRESQTQALLMLSAWSRLIVGELIRHDDEEGLLRPRIDNPVVGRILEELDQWLHRPVKLSEIAHRSGFSIQHLNRIFRQVLGMTLLQYIVRAKLERATTLLREGRLTIAAVAKEVGFQDAYYFSRLFKKHYGQSPIQYREALDSYSPSECSTAPFTTN